MVLLVSAITVCGEEKNTTEGAIALNKITVAIINFESNAPGNPELGQQLGDILTARMSIYDQFQLVERKKLEELLKEPQLNLTGMVDPDQAIKIGKMLGARIMVFGRAFPVDKDLYIAAKIVGTETGQVKGVIAKGKLEGNLSDIIDQLVEKLADGLEKWAPQLLPPNEKVSNKIEILKQQLAGKKLPTIAVIVSETHMNQQKADSAAETEIKKIFKEVGFNVIEVKRKTLEQSAKDVDLAGVDVVITGEGFSEFGARIGGLVSCVARFEVQATDRDSRKIITSERTIRRAVDLSEAIAGKTALQAAGHELAIKTIEKIAEDINKKKDANSPKN
jgi:hypothetical protein